MASTPIRRGNGWQVKWRHKGTNQSITEIHEEDAKRLKRYLDSMKPHTVTAESLRDRRYLVGHVAAQEMTAKARTFAVVWAEYAASRSWSEGTRRGHLGAMALHFGSWMNRPVDEIAAADLNERWASIRAGMTENSAIATMAPAKATLTYAFEMGWTRYNPRSKRVADHLHFKIDPNPESPRDALTARQLAAFLSHANEAERVMLQTCYEIGARNGEFGALLVGNFCPADPDDVESVATITITGTMQGTQRQPWTKGERGRATVVKPHPIPISDELAAMLVPLVAGRKASEPLFVHTYRGGFKVGNGHWSTSTFRALFNRVADRARTAGVRLPEEFVPHTLRHTMATLLAAELPVLDLMRRMRHKSVKQTQRYYHGGTAAQGRERKALSNVMGLAA